jgi:hypothetical protein
MVGAGRRGSVNREVIVTRADSGGSTVAIALGRTELRPVEIAAATDEAGTPSDETGATMAKIGVPSGATQAARRIREEDRAEKDIDATVAAIRHRADDQQDAGQISARSMATFAKSTVT